jgi:hypothetical protein
MARTRAGQRDVEDRPRLVGDLDREQVFARQALVEAQQHVTCIVERELVSFMIAFPVI